MLELLHNCVSEKQFDAVLGVACEYLSVMCPVKYKKYRDYLRQLCDSSSNHYGNFRYNCALPGFPVETNRNENFNLQLKNGVSSSSRLFCHPECGSLQSILKISEKETFCGEVVYKIDDVYEDEHINLAEELLKNPNNIYQKKSVDAPKCSNLEYVFTQKLKLLMKDKDLWNEEEYRFRMDEHEVETENGTETLHDVCELFEKHSKPHADVDTLLLLPGIMFGETDNRWYFAKVKVVYKKGEIIPNEWFDSNRFGSDNLTKFLGVKTKKTNNKLREDVYFVVCICEWKGVIEYSDPHYLYPFGVSECSKYKFDHCATRCQLGKMGLVPDELKKLNATQLIRVCNANSTTQLCA